MGEHFPQNRNPQLVSQYQVVSPETVYIDRFYGLSRLYLYIQECTEMHVCVCVCVKQKMQEAMNLRERGERVTTWWRECGRREGKMI